MNALLDNFRLAISTFIHNPLRSLLTLLGIVIGVATVIAMMAMIEGLRLKIAKDVARLGADSFQVQKEPFGFGRMDWNKIAKRKNLTLDDRDAILESCPSVLTAAALTGQGGQKVSTSERETRPSVRVIGGTPELPQTSSLGLVAGRAFGHTEYMDAAEVAILGPDVVDSLFPEIDPIGQTIRIKNRPFRVIGVTERRGSFMGGGSQDNMVIVPLSIYQTLFGERRSLEISVQASDPALLKKAQDEVTSLLRRRRGLKPMDENDFFVFSNESAIKMFDEISGVISVASFGVTILSLIVGGIGILNIMLVSVTERTKEIGIRKALGARRRRILAQFTTEAIALALFGGAIGILLGFGLSGMANWLLGFATSVPLWAVVASVVMSSGVGLLFGIYPAFRAAKLDPVEAMRTE